MPGPVHIFLHLALCSAAAQAPPETTLPVHVTMAYHVGGNEVDRVFKVVRGDGAEVVAEFDIPRSLYKLQVDLPQYKCGVTDFIDVLSDHNRTITETLVPAPVPAPAPVVMLDGAAPLSFAYLRPTFVVFPAGSACDQPVNVALPVPVRVEYDPGAYYVGLGSDSGTGTAGSLVVALRLRTTTGLAHYVRLPLPFPQPWDGWPTTVRFNITEEMIDGLITEKTDTLLCPKMWETKVG
jgi:hypothetical protein